MKKPLCQAFIGWSLTLVSDTSVTFEPEGQRITAQIGETIFQVA